MEWKIIQDYPDYDISNEGLVRRRDTGHLLKCRKTKTGYCQVNLYKNKISANCYVHRLVLVAFAGDCSQKRECNHKNGDKRDNDIKNLEWVTRTQNVRHALKMGLQTTVGETHPWAKLSIADVKEIRALLKTGLFQRQIADRFNIGQTTVSAIKRRENWAYLQC